MKPRALISLLLGLVALGAIGGGAAWFVQAGQMQAAVESYLPARPDTTGFPDVLDDAIAAADAKARSRTGALDGMKELSALYHANGFFDQAIACYTGLAAIEPTEARWLHLHATIIAGFGMADQALELWQQVVVLDPTYVPALLRIGDISLKSNRLAEATTAYTAAEQQDAGNAYALLGLARIDLEAGDEAAALTKLEQVVRRSNYNLGYDLIVTLYENAGEDAKAEAIRGQMEASGAFRDPPDPWLDGLLTYCYDPFRIALEAGTKARIGELDLAVSWLQRAIELDPNDVSNTFQLGNLYKMQGKLNEAGAQYRRCTLLDPGFADGWAQLSDVLAQSGNLGEADRILNAGLEAVPDSPGLHITRARRYRATNQIGAAIADYRASIRYRPNEPDPYIELAFILLKQGRSPDAISLLETALVYDPANPTALTTLAFHAIESGNRPNADAWLTKIADQPRVERNQVSQLREAYRNKFGTLPPL